MKKPEKQYRIVYGENGEIKREYFEAPPKPFKKFLKELLKDNNKAFGTNYKLK